ncbi:MAG: Uma2 family endonuclease [Pirellulales bacterium]
MSMLDHPTTAVGDWTVPVLASPLEPTPKKWTREEYYQLGELGWFQNERVELIDGEIITLPPQSFGHYWCIDQLHQLLNEVFPRSSGYWVRSQGPIHASRFSEPEPDIAVVRGSREQFEDHPTTAVLMVEVSRSSISYDRRTKASLYASIAVPDYWVLDVEARVLEVRRQPVEDASQRFGWRYQEVLTIDATGSVAPLENPKVSLAVADMLPPVKQ